VAFFHYCCQRLLVSPPVILPFHWHKDWHNLSGQPIAGSAEEKSV
jgi:hypothetical protein